MLPRDSDCVLLHFLELKFWFCCYSFRCIFICFKLKRVSDNLPTVALTKSLMDDMSMSFRWKKPGINSVDPVVPEYCKIEVTSFTATMVGSRVYCIGIIGRKRQYNTSSYCVYDIATGEWRWVDIPGPYLHSTETVLFKDALYCYGGTNMHAKRMGAIACLYRFDTVMEEWTNCTRQMRGPRPGELFSHVVELLDEKLMVVFGGGDRQQRRVTNELKVMDMRWLAWTTPRVKGTPPSARIDHASCSAGGAIYIFGGTDPDGNTIAGGLFRLTQYRDELIWSTLRWTGYKKAPVVYCSMCYAYDRLFVFGGYDENISRCDELCYYDLEESQWELYTAGNEGNASLDRSPACHQRSIFQSNQIYQIGGSYRNFPGTTILELLTKP